jgi:hypothetical protein
MNFLNVFAVNKQITGIFILPAINKVCRKK